MNNDGSNQVNLTDNPADDLEMVWSPDGSRIAFLSNRDGNAEIYIMNAAAVAASAIEGKITDPRKYL